LGLTRGSKEYIDALNGFIGEIMNHSKLSHENIVPFVGVVMSSHHPDEPKYLVTSAAECSLAQLLLNMISKGERLALDEYIGISEDVLRALSYLDEAHAVHRNIKPTSVFVFIKTDDVQFKIGEFTLLQVEPVVAELSSAGTLHYMAPEIERFKAGDIYHSRADVFSFGVMMADIFVKHVLCESLGATREDTIAKAIESANRLREGALDPDEREGFSVVSQLLAGCCEVDTTTRLTAAAALELVDCKV
jgi:serine/threonine protein kinase